MRWPRYEPVGNHSRAANALRSQCRATMRAAVYRGKGRVVVETVPVPGNRSGRSFDSRGGLRNLRHGPEENSSTDLSPPRRFSGTKLREPWSPLGAGVTQMEAGRPRHELSSRSVRVLFLLRAAPVFAVPGLQESRPDGGLRSQRRRIRPIRARHAVGCRARHGGDSGRISVSTKPRSSSQ